MPGSPRLLPRSPLVDVLVGLFGKQTSGVLGVPEQCRHLLQVRPIHLVPPIGVRKRCRRRQQLRRPHPIHDFARLKYEQSVLRLA